MKLTDINLTDRQVDALLSLLEQLADGRDRQAQKDADEARREAWHDRCYNRLRYLAQVTAQLHGRIPGITVYDAAVASWRSFAASEGFFCSEDVARNFAPNTADWEEPWILEYTNAVYSMTEGKLTRLTVDEAAALRGDPVREEP